MPRSPLLLKGSFRVLTLHTWHIPALISEDARTTAFGLRCGTRNQSLNLRKFRCRLWDAACWFSNFCKGCPRLSMSYERPKFGVSEKLWTQGFRMHRVSGVKVKAKGSRPWHLVDFRFQASGFARITWSFVCSAAPEEPFARRRRKAEHQRHALAHMCGVCPSV